MLWRLQSQTILVISSGVAPIYWSHPKCRAAAFGISEVVSNCSLWFFRLELAISNHRLQSVSNFAVSFHWEGCTHNSEQRTMTLSPEQFLRCFLLHVLPRGSPRIRYSAGSPIALVSSCCRSAASCSIRHHRQKTHPPLLLLPGRARATKAHVRARTQRKSTAPQPYPPIASAATSVIAST
jgi:hypothetical protein